MGIDISSVDLISRLVPKRYCYNYRDWTCRSPSWRHTESTIPTDICWWFVGNSCSTSNHSNGTHGYPSFYKIVWMSSHNSHGLVIIAELDIDEAFEIVKAHGLSQFTVWRFYRSIGHVGGWTQVWIDWGENSTDGAIQGYSVTNIGTISPDNSYLVFNAEGSILGKLSSSLYQSSWRRWILPGSHTSGQCSRYWSNVADTGYRPTVPSRRKAKSRSNELSILLDW